MDELLKRIRDCKLCETNLPMGVNPILAAHHSSKIIVIGQAPGRKVHQTSIPWNDKSGDNLRSWLGIDKEVFYDPRKIALIPMGFCYPGTGKSGDLPPRTECAPLWHEPLLNAMDEPKLILLIGQYAQSYYLKDSAKASLTDTVFNFKEYLPLYFPLPHPSPRNNIWQKKNDWFSVEIIPELRKRVRRTLKIN